MADTNGPDATENVIFRERIDEAAAHAGGLYGFPAHWVHLTALECVNASSNGGKLGARYRTVQLPPRWIIKRILGLDHLRAPEGDELVRFAARYWELHPKDGRFQELRMENAAANQRQNERRRERLGQVTSAEVTPQGEIITIRDEATGEEKRYLELPPA